MAVEPILGIDLGTTFSTAAVVLDGRFHYALDGRGDACIPSVVHFPRSGPVLVGHDAEKLRATDPVNTIVGIKRVIAKDVASPAARILDASSAFKLKGAGAHEVSVVTRSGEYTASQVASFIVRHLKERAEARFGRPFTKCFMTVPVVAGPEVRDAMLRIGRMAGLEVVRVLSEPVAGALARGLAGASGSDAPTLVYDFGGGTLDTTVVQRQGDRISVRSAGGDDCLGGNDFDLAFARWVGDAIWGMASIDVTKDALLFDRIQRQCELVKRALSGTKEARFFVPDALGTPGQRRSLDVQVKREHLVGPWKELVDRSLKVAAETVVAAGLGPRELASVMLIGGTTWVPQVRDAVAKTIPVPLDVESDPQTAVARGAALLAVMPRLLLD
ncbi:MAG: Hsp70 family protein [Myxococcaceae bacterium]|nr:Hsp70 family protein [Myxococcaceae bacterium]